IFDKSCIKCHGSEKQKGKLRLDSLEATLKGGQDGKVVEPGKSAESILVHNVAHLGDEDDFMPPPDNKDKIPPLTKDQIGLIRAWIDQGRSNSSGRARHTVRVATTPTRRARSDARCIAWLTRTPFSCEL